MSDKSLPAQAEPEPDPAEYVAPVIESVTTAEDLGREVQYAAVASGVQ